MWTNVKFWKDSTWRAFRTFCQTLAALLAAQFSGLLQVTGAVVADGALPHTPWLGFLYTSFIAGLISLLQSIDRERATGGVTAVAPTVVVEPVEASGTTFGTGDPARADYRPY